MSMRSTPDANGPAAISDGGAAGIHDAAGTMPPGISGSSTLVGSTTGLNGPRLPVQSTARKPVTGGVMPSERVHSHAGDQGTDDPTVAQVDADVLAVGVHHQVAAFGLFCVGGEQVVRGEPAQVAGRAQSGAADLAQLAGVGERAEDQARAVDGRWTLSADSIRRAQVCPGGGDNGLDARGVSGAGPRQLVGRVRPRGHCRLIGERGRGHESCEKGEQNSGQPRIPAATAARPWTSGLPLLDCAGWGCGRIRVSPASPQYKMPVWRSSQAGAAWRQVSPWPG